MISISSPEIRSNFSKVSLFSRPFIFFSSASRSSLAASSPSSSPAFAFHIFSLIFHIQEVVEGVMTLFTSAMST